MTNSWVLNICLVALAYIFGSMPFGYWIGKLVKGKHFDIRDWGSGNIGATNALKILKWAGLLVLIADTAKGYLPVFMAKELNLNQWWVAACLLAPGLGHFRSIWMYWIEGKFSGGKSVATFWAASLALNAPFGGLILAIWIIAVLLTGYISAGSMIATLATFILTWVFHLDPIFRVIYGLVALVIIYAHARNIGRIIQGTEPKWYEKRGAHNLIGDEVVSSFGTHPLSLADFEQSLLSKWLYDSCRSGKISEKTVRELIAKYGKVMEYDQITGIVTKTGRKARVLLKGIALLPDQLLSSRKDPRNPELYDPKMTAVLDNSLKAGAVLSQRGGAVDFGLGALLSSVSPNGGEDLQQWCRDRRLSITIDNGAAFTIGATVAVIRRETAIPLGKAVVANVGASGIIGHGIVNYLRDEVGEILAFARDSRKIDDLAGFAKTYASSEEFANIGKADIVIFNTNAGKLLTAENAHLLKKNALVIDVSVPPDVLDEVAEVRQDIRLFRSGLIKMPGKPKCKTDLHFGHVFEDSAKIELVPACLVQGVLMALTNDFSHASRGARIRREDVDFFLEVAEREGFEIISSRVSEPTLFSGSNK